MDVELPRVLHQRTAEPVWHIPSKLMGEVVGDNVWSKHAGKPRERACSDPATYAGNSLAV